MDGSHAIGLAASATDQGFSPEMANPGGQSSLDFGDLAHRVCYRCRDTPWVSGPFDSSARVERTLYSLSAKCPICDLLISRNCEMGDYGAALTWNAEYQTSSIFRPRSEDSTGSQILLRQLYWDQDHDKLTEHLIWTSDVNEGIAKSDYEYCDSPKISFSQVREHIDVCMKTHKSCSLEYFRPLVDLRIIDCERRLVVDAPTDCKYIALSYVWGTPSGSEDFVLSHSLPPTVEHSILTTLKLGYRYLWIDRYCIDQQNQEHTSRQILQMSTIYQRADLTIIAAAGSNPFYGLPGVQKRRSVRPLVVHTKVGSRWFSKVPTDTTLAEIYMINIAKSKWASRAWTYQEAIFSRRRLIFTNRQVIINCNTESRLESGIGLPNHNLDFLRSLWTCRKTDPGYQLVSGHISCMEQYCGRKLTKDSDALNAILSTLEAVSERDYYHIWGVPVRCRGQDFASNNESHSTLSDSVCKSGPYHPNKTTIWLSWRHLSKLSRRRPDFPSWSPLGWADAPIRWKETSHFTGAVSVCKPAGVEFLSDHLLCGTRNPHKMSQLLVVRMKTTQGVTYHPNDGSLRISVGKGYYIRRHVHWDSSSFTTNESMKIAVIGESEETIEVLLLIAVSDHYERIGYCAIDKNSLNDFNGFHDLWIQQDKSYRWVNPCLDDDIWKADEERLRATFEDLDNYLWWEHVFKEEYITLG